MVFVTHTMQLCLNTLIIIINIQYIYVQVRYKPVSIQPEASQKNSTLDSRRTMLVIDDCGF